eukprot:CAMPEP_0181219194 /NCGR_PEP_ID=MMETSP1096-20121128/28122_1 /TAXON_ID=156174 ORGANISM="Chrysochromulina ericina, Strain CCMP281" /NCGR_SAMPLE_ID=MMETSP1096 /ASSEMBLY_ACC=CAM_ASM_000453 /LENGTH=73 /DNA_ID=CAMNT_0023311511 /DNA_START=341 /DNA_END=559 /DNA_ORIENTATION=-
MPRASLFPARRLSPAPLQLCHRVGDANWGNAPLSRNARLSRTRPLPAHGTGGVASVASHAGELRRRAPPPPGA